jgi:hypothetical protein
MLKIFVRSALPGSEQISLIVITALFLAISIYLAGQRIYVYAFLTEIVPPPPMMYGDLRERLWTYIVVVGFMFSFWITLIVTSFSIAFKKVILSIVCFSIPAVFAFLFSLDTIVNASNVKPNSLQEFRAENPFFPFHYQELLLFTFLISLVLWHIKILIQDKMQAGNLASPLP